MDDNNEVINELMDYVAENDKITLSFKTATLARKAIEEVQQYKEVGTVEEFKALKEKSIPKKPIEKPDCYMKSREITCPTCGSIISKYRNKYCDCGQNINWE